MVKSTIGNEIGRMSQKGLSSRSPKDAGSPSVKMKSGPVISSRKANNRKSGRSK
jgi:hypothetical protein